jgi:hypothetical protein
MTTQIPGAVSPDDHALTSHEATAVERPTLRDVHRDLCRPDDHADECPETADLCPYVDQ